MSLIRNLIDKWKSRRSERQHHGTIGTVTSDATAGSPPVIQTEWGPTTEWARHQAAINIRENPEVRQRVEDLLTEQYGSREAGLREMKRRYPEAESIPLSTSLYFPHWPYCSHCGENLGTLHPQANIAPHMDGSCAKESR